MHKEGKWARHIIRLQDEEGKWGCFHSLSQLNNAPMTTEQALRRLKVLGLSIVDPSIQRAVAYMDDCLAGRMVIPDRREKVSDWDVFSCLILATWIRCLIDGNILANQVADQWAQVVTEAFSDGVYEESRYVSAYRDVLQPKYGRINGFAMFYPVSLLRGCLDPVTEQAVVSYLLNREDGICYIYDRKLADLPSRFESREASRYLGAIELLAEYSAAREQLGFVVDWLLLNRNSNGRWDMGKTVNDKVYFPLSDDWRRSEAREADCSERIVKLLNKIC